MPRRKTPPKADTPTRELWNLSDLTAEWLAEIGIHTYGDLCEANLYVVWRELKLRHRQVTKLMFYALWGAVANCHWNQIPEAEIINFDEWRASQ